MVAYTILFICNLTFMGYDMVSFKMKKTISELIDELISCNLKIFNLVDLVQANLHTKEDAKKIQDLNLYRSQLKNAINQELGGRQEIKL